MSKRLLLGLGCLLVLTTLSLLSTRRVRTPQSAGAVHAERASRADGLEMESRQSPRQATDATSSAPEEPPRSLELITRAAIDTAYWPPLNNTRGFDDIDMSRLKLLVEQHELSFHELLHVARSVPVGDTRRAIALAATAFCDTTVAQQGELAALVRESIAAMQTMDREAASAGFAALFSLLVHDAEDALLHAAQDLAAVYSTQSATNGAVPWALMLAADGAATPTIDEDFAMAAREVEPTSATSALWGVLARSRPLEVLRAAESNGHAREGLERVRDPSLVPVLIGIATRPRDSVYSGFMAESAACALLTLPSEAAWDAFESLVVQQLPAAVDALHRSSAPAAVGDLIRLEDLLGQDERTRAAALPLESCVERSLRALARCQTSRETSRRACQSLRANWEHVQVDSANLARAIEVLALHGDSEDRRFAQQWLWRVDDTLRERIERALSYRS